jgi:hypothetical protein
VVEESEEGEGVVDESDGAEGREEEEKIYKWGL